MRNPGSCVSPGERLRLKETKTQVGPSVY